MKPVIQQEPTGCGIAASATLAGVLIRPHYRLDSKQALTQNGRTDFGRIKPKWFIGISQ